MGTDALLSSGVTEKMLYLIRDPRAQSPTDPLNKVRKSRIALFVLVELIGFGATFAITQTIAAIGFPIIIMLLVPARYFVVPHLGFTDEELEVLDGPVASPFVSARYPCAEIIAHGADDGVGRRGFVDYTWASLVSPCLGLVSYALTTVSSVII